MFANGTFVLHFRPSGSRECRAGWGLAALPRWPASHVLVTGLLFVNIIFPKTKAPHRAEVAITKQKSGESIKNHMPDYLFVPPPPSYCYEFQKRTAAGFLRRLDGDMRDCPIMSGLSMNSFIHPSFLISSIYLYQKNCASQWTTFCGTNTPWPNR